MGTQLKIGIFGGTFNPIHNGHIGLVQAAIDQLKLDKCLVVPSGNSYMKHGVLEALHRVNMVNLAIRNHDKMKISLVEVNRGGNSYTSQTLDEIAKIEGNAEYYLIVGGDAFLQMDIWYEHEKIYRTTSIGVALRDGCSTSEIDERAKFLNKTYGTNIITINVKDTTTSSTAIRTLIREGKSVNNYVGVDVAKYIEENNLYKL